MTARLGAVALVVAEYDAAIAWFTRCLRFRLVQDIAIGAKRWVVIEPPGGGARLLLAQASGPEQVAAIGHQAGGRVWLFLESDDFGADHAHMLAEGVVFEESPRHEHYGIVAVFRDLYGNRWDLVQHRHEGWNDEPKA